MAMAQKEAVRILITDAGGQVAWDLLPFISRGVMLGLDQPVIVHLLHHASDLAAVEDLKAAVFSSPVLRAISTTDVEEASKNVEFAIVIGKVSKKTARLRSNPSEEYKQLAAALENHAAANCKVLVIAYPAHMVALTLKKFAPSIHPKNITCLTRSYHNCALGLISERLNIPARYLNNVIIWGNHMPPLHLDLDHATVGRLSDEYAARVGRSAGEYTVRELIDNDAWLNGEFMDKFQKCAALGLDEKKSGAILLAKAVCDHIHDWVFGTREGTWVSVGIFSDGSYNVPAGLIYAFPVISRNGEWTIVQGLPLDEFSRKKMDSTVEELMKEQSLTVAYIERNLLG